MWFGGDELPSGDQRLAQLRQLSGAKPCEDSEVARRERERERERSEFRRGWAVTE